MKKLMAIALGVSVLAMSSMAFAQAEQYDFGIFADAAGTQTTVAAAPFTPFDWFVVGFGLDGQVKGFEVTVSVPAGLTVLTRVIAGPGPVNLGGEPDEFIIGTGGCVDAGPGAFVLVQYNGGFFTPTVGSDLAVIAGGTTPSSFPGGVPGYLQCDGDLIPAGVATDGSAGGYPNGALIINATGDAPVATEAATFGDLKARF
jgi:hypothetical protein